MQRPGDNDQNQAVLNGVFQYGDTMADAASDNKQVPDEVGVPNAFGRIEPDTNGIDHATGHQPIHSRRRHIQPQGFHRNDDQPAHDQIECEGELFKPHTARGLENDAGHGNAPDHAEQGPAPYAPQHPKGEWRICPGDKEENGAVIQNVEHLLGSVAGQ